MNETSPEPIAERFRDIAACSEAIRRAAREAALAHARAGNPVATLREEKVVWLQPEEVFALLADSKAMMDDGK